MKAADYRKLYVRAFVHTGRDGEVGLVRYINDLENALLTLEKIHTKRAKRKPKPFLSEMIHQIKQGMYLRIPDGG